MKIWTLASLVLLVVSIANSTAGEEILIVTKSTKWENNSTARNVKILQKFQDRGGYLHGFENGKEVHVSAGLIAAQLVMPQDPSRSSFYEINSIVESLNQLVLNFPNAKELSSIQKSYLIHRHNLRQKVAETQSDAPSGDPGLPNGQSETFASRDGRVLTGVTKVTVEPNGVMVNHDSGVTKISFDQLTSEQIQEYGLSEERARKYTEEEEARQKESNARREAARVHQEKVRRNAELIERYGMDFQGEVIQVHPGDGVLFSGSIDGRLVRLAFIDCDTREIIDGQLVGGTAFPVGTKTYNTAAGSIRTVPKYTLSVEQFIIQRAQ